MKTFKILILWIALGIVYFSMELVYRHGHTHPAMIAVGGLCGLLIGSCNQNKSFYKMPIVIQSFVGAAIVLIVELLSGLLLNTVMGLDIWDYSRYKYNLFGQICLGYSGVWFLISPFAIWLEDFMRHILFKEHIDYTLIDIYIDLVKGK